MPWEKYVKRNPQRKIGLFVRIYKPSMLISLSADLADEITTTHIELLYNKEEHKIGIRPSEMRTDLKLRNISNSAVRTASAKGFIQRFELQEIIGHTYPVVKEGDMYIASLDQFDKESTYP